MDAKANDSKEEINGRIQATGPEKASIQEDH
jgi:hypothetical protein